ncbi:hypothetical protein LTS18_010375, partial [Coniosporium uncinatum]
KHNNELDNTTWPAWYANQTGWCETLNVTGSAQLGFSDIGLWPELLGLNESTTPSVG